LNRASSPAGETTAVLRWNATRSRVLYTTCCGDQFTAHEFLTAARPSPSRSRPHRQMTRCRDSRGPPRSRTSRCRSAPRLNGRSSTLQFEKAEPAAHVGELKIRPTWLQAHALQAIGGRGIAAALRVDLKCALLAGRLTRIVKDPRTRKCYWCKHLARGAHETPSRHAVEI